MSTAISTKINDLISGLKPIRLSQSGQGLPASLLDNAGSDFFQTYNVLWQGVHRRAEHAAIMAEKTENTIASIENDILRRNGQLDQLRSELSELPNMISSIDRVSEQIESISKQISSVEGLLKQLKSLDEIADLEELKRQEREEVRRREEEKERRVLMERQAAFAAAFHEDLERYKLSGKVDKIEGIYYSKDQSPELAEVAIEEDEHDREALSKFLDSQETENASSSSKTDETKE